MFYLEIKQFKSNYTIHTHMYIWSSCKIVSFRNISFLSFVIAYILHLNLILTKLTVMKQK